MQEDPPDLVGISYAADVLKREKRLILVVRETVSSYTTACFIDDKKHESPSLSHVFEANRWA